MKNNNNHFNDKLIEFVYKHEGFVNNPYLCPARVWTIGIGHAIRYKKKLLKSPQISFKEAYSICCAPWSFEFAQHILYLDLKEAISTLETNIIVKLNDNQKTALIDFIFNVGSKAFISSTLLHKINNKDINNIDEEFMKWRLCSGKINNGLINRRKDESLLFMS
jgi:lysozyme